MKLHVLLTFPKYSIKTKLQHQFFYFSKSTRLLEKVISRGVFLQKMVSILFYVLYIQEAYSESCQTSKMEPFAKIVNGFSSYIFSQNAPSYMFDRFLNTPLYSLYIHLPVILITGRNIKHEIHQTQGI